MTCKRAVPLHTHIHTHWNTLRQPSAFTECREAQLTPAPTTRCWWWVSSASWQFCCRNGACFSSAQSLSRVRLLATPWAAAHQASLSITNSWSLLIFMSIESVMPSKHLTLCHPLLLLPPSIFPSIRAFSNESALCIRWPKYWSFSFSPSNEYSGLISFRID